MTWLLWMSLIYFVTWLLPCSKCCNLPELLAVPKTHSAPLLNLLYFLESPLLLLVCLTNSYSFVKIQTNCCFSKAPKPLLRDEFLSFPIHHLFPYPVWWRWLLQRRLGNHQQRSPENLHFPIFSSILEDQEREVIYPRPRNKLPAELRLEVKNVLSFLWDFLMPTRHSLGLDPLPILCS